MVLLVFFFHFFRSWINFTSSSIYHVVSGRGGGAGLVPMTAPGSRTAALRYITCACWCHSDRVVTFGVVTCA